MAGCDKSVMPQTAQVWNASFFPEYSRTCVAMRFFPVFILQYMSLPKNRRKLLIEASTNSRVDQLPNKT